VKMVEQDRQPAAGATRKFAAMVATYALGVFNDNFFKQAACLTAIAIGVDAFVWFVAVVQILVINELGLAQFAIGKAYTSCLVAAELGGVAVGGLLARRLATGPRWWRVLTPGLLLLAGATVLVAAVPWLPVPVQLPAVVAAALSRVLPERDPP